MWIPLSFRGNFPIPRTCDTGRFESQYKDLTSIGIPIVKITWSHHYLIFKIGIPIPGEMVFILTLQWWYMSIKLDSNHWQLNILFNGVFRLTTKNTLNFHITDPLWGECTGDKWICHKKASNADSHVITWSRKGSPVLPWHLHLMNHSHPLDLWNRYWLASVWNHNQWNLGLFWSYRTYQ